MRHHKIPDETIRRLPLYWRAFQKISQNEKTHISSQSLESIVNINHWQIRKDLSYFGALGIRGTGYDVKRLTKATSHILKLNKTQKVVLVGVGNLGTALLRYNAFESYGLNIIVAFDSNSKKIGKKINNVTVKNISALHEVKSKNNGIHIGIIAVPATSAQDIADKLIDAGIYGILNFAPIKLTVPKKVTVINIDIALELARLLYYMPAKLTKNKLRF